MSQNRSAKETIKAKDFIQWIGKKKIQNMEIDIITNPPKPKEKKRKKERKLKNSHQIPFVQLSAKRSSPEGHSTH